MKIILPLLFIFISNLAIAEKTYPIDISGCVNKNICTRYSGDMYDPGYYADENIKLLAWFSVTKLSVHETHHFYPIFNVFNKTKNTLKVELKMELLNINHDVLVDKSFTYDIAPYSGAGDPRFISMNAVPISLEDISYVSFVRVSHNIK